MCTSVGDTQTYPCISIISCCAYASPMHVCTDFKARGLLWMSFLRVPSTLYLRQSLSGAKSSPIQGGWLISSLRGLVLLHFSSTGKASTYNHTPFTHGCWWSNWGPHVYMVDTWETEPSPQHHILQVAILGGLQTHLKPHISASTVLRLNSWSQSKWGAISDVHWQNKVWENETTWYLSIHILNTYWASSMPWAVSFH